MVRAASLTLSLVLPLALAPPASAQPALDPAWLGPAPALACLPYGTGAIEHAVHVDARTIAITRQLDPLLPTGYDGMDAVRAFELRRTSDLGLVVSRVLGSPATALAVSRDGLRVAVGTYDGTQVFETTTGAETFHVTGITYALAFGPYGDLAISHGEQVDVVDTHGTLENRIAITGSAPTVIHAMRLDGECDEIHTATEARAGGLAFARDGTLLASVSDGSVRTLAADDTQRWTRPAPPDRDRGYAMTAVSFEPVSDTLVRVTYSDAFTVTLRTPALTSTGPRAATCSAAELAIARRRLGASALGEPPTCAGAVSVDVDASGRTMVLGPITRVHARGGSSLLVAPTLHDTAGLLVGDEAWLFGIDGTGERWTLGPAGGRFGGALPIPGRAGVVLDVGRDGRWVAIGMPVAEPHGSETFDGYALSVVDTRTETVLAGVTARSARARFVPGTFASGTTRIAIEIDEQGHRAVEVREIPSGARVRRVALADAEYGGLVAVDARRLVVAEGPHLRVIALADGAERTIDLPDGVVEAASLAGDRLAMRVYDRTTPDIGDHRIDVVDLSGTALRVAATAPGASGHDVAIDGGGAVYAGADGTAHRLDLASGAVSDVAGLPAGAVSGLAPTRGGWLSSRRGPAGARLWLGGVETQTTVLDWARADDHAGAAIAYELGGTAYVIGHDGRTRATLSVLDGGLVVRTVGGAFSVTPEARAALAVRDGDVLRACDASMEALHVPGLLEALLAP